jgi:hypothetical protein
MKIAVIDDYPDVFRRLNCSSKLRGHEVWCTTTPRRILPVLPSVDGVEAVLLTQRRCAFRANSSRSLPR